MKQTKRMSKYFTIPTPVAELISVAAFFKHDTDHGIGVIIPKGQLEFIFNLVLDMIDSWENDWEIADENARMELYNYALGQLEQWGRLGSKRSESEGVMAIANIAFLERHGRINPDNFNGLLLGWAQHNNPSK